MKSFPKHNFWARVSKTNTCWIWIGRITERGYGKYGNEFAHRRVFREIEIEIPPGLVCDHICKNKKCVNPKHLRFVTQKQNVTENSDSLPAKNKTKTTCHLGHPFDLENTWIDSEGARRCLKCKRTNAANMRKKQWWLDHVREKDRAYHWKNRERINARKREASK